MGKGGLFDRRSFLSTAALAGVGLHASCSGFRVSGSEYRAPDSGFRVVHLPRKILVAAHRGANEFAPENTLPAFRISVELGVDLIEIDIRKTKDDINVILHDSTLNRTTSMEGNILERTFNEIKDASAGKWFSDEFASEKIPTLEETCLEVIKWNEYFGKKVSFYVDCKNPEVPKMIQTLKEYDFLDTSVFYSGSDAILEEIRKNAPQAKLMPAYGRGEQLQSRIERLKPYAFDTSWRLLTEELVAQINQLGIKVYSDAHWSASKEDLVGAMEMGVSLIQTDRIHNVYEAEREWKK